jgi:cytochrome c biogenesis protein CcmG/thiol:disulfide interchange protein DsbE
MHRLKLFMTVLLVSGLPGASLLGASLLAGCASHAVSQAAISPDNAARIGLDQHRGDVVYLDFWASWCAPCAQSFPWMSEVQERYRADGLVIIAVNLDKDRDKADRFLARYQLNFELVYDPDGRIAKEFDLGGMPTSYLIGRDGAIRQSHVGFRDGDASRLEDEIKSLLAEPAGMTGGAR